MSGERRRIIADPAARVLDAALAVARNAASRRHPTSSSALIYWPLIEELRGALDELGVEWRVEPRAVAVAPSMRRVACVCGYVASDSADLDEHCIAMARAGDAEDHAEAH